MRVHTRHAAIADGGEEHGDHGQQDYRDDVSAGFSVENAEDRHRRRGLDQDNSVEDQIPEAQRALQSHGLGLRLGSGRHSNI